MPTVVRWRTHVRIANGAAQARSSPGPREFASLTRHAAPPLLLCHLIAPYLNTVMRAGARITGLSQNDEATTHTFISAIDLAFFDRR
jgi:hypothetical protein